MKTMRYIMALAAVCLLVTSVSFGSTTLIWSDEFDGGAAAQLDDTKWVTPSAGTVDAGGFAIVTGSTFAIPDYDHSSLYTIKIGMRVPASSQPLASDHKPIACNSKTNGQIRYELYTFGSTTADDRINVLRVLDATGQLVYNADVYKQTGAAIATDFQEIKIVLGPGLQRVFVNDGLMTQSSASVAEGEQWSVFLQGDATKTVQYDYIRVYEGMDEDEDLVWRDDFNSVAGTTVCEDWWPWQQATMTGNGSALHSSTGTTDLLRTPYGSGDWPRRAPMQTMPSYGVTHTCDFYTRFPAAYFVYSNDELILGVRSATDPQNPRFMLYMIGGSLTYRSSIVSDVSEIGNVSTFFTGNAATDFQHFRFVLSATQQALYINGVEAKKTYYSIASGAEWMPYLNGNNNHRAETDQLAVFRGDKQNPLLNEVGSDRWELLK